MPVSKRGPGSAKVQLAAVGGVQKARRERKDALIDKIRDCLQEFEYLYVFQYQNLRTNQMKEVRLAWPSSRFFMGNNKVMQVALGRTPEEEAAENSCLVADHVQGSCGLFFTDEEPEKVQEFFANFSEAGYAKSGFVATESRTLPAGPTEFEFSQETYLRNTLGMPTSLKNGVVNLEGDFTVCTKGQPLTSEQARLLKLLDVKMADFVLPLTCVYSQGRFKTL
jgi:mRNA turnover protein 4